MDKPISVGDLVMVVRSAGCCGNALANGKVFVVSELGAVSGVCQGCRKWLADVPVAWKNKGRNLGIAIGRLRRIPPLGELEGEKQREPEEACT